MSGDDGDAWAATASKSSGLTQFFVFVVAFQLRRLVRARLHIPGSCLGDLACTFFCAPCALTQMVGQLWRRPAATPGCTLCSDEPGGLP